MVSHSFRVRTLLDYTRRAGGPKGRHQLLMSAYVSHLVPWFSKYRSWNFQNLVPKTSKSPTFGTLILQISLVKLSKSGPQNLKIVHFRVPFLDRILNVSRAKFGVSRSQKELKMTQKCNNCFGIVRTDTHTHRHRQTDAHQNFGSLHNRPFGQCRYIWRILKKNFQNFQNRHIWWVTMILQEKHWKPTSKSTKYRYFRLWRTQNIYLHFLPFV